MFLQKFSTSLKMIKQLFVLIDFSCKGCPWKTVLICTDINSGKVNKQISSLLVNEWVEFYVILHVVLITEYTDSKYPLVVSPYISSSCGRCMSIPPKCSHHWSIMPDYTRHDTLPSHIHWKVGQPVVFPCFNPSEIPVDNRQTKHFHSVFPALFPQKYRTIK